MRVPANVILPATATAVSLISAAVITIVNRSNRNAIDTNMERLIDQLQHAARVMSSEEHNRFMNSLSVVLDYKRHQNKSLSNDLKILLSVIPKPKLDEFLNEAGISKNQMMKELQKPETLELFRKKMSEPNKE